MFNKCYLHKNKPLSSLIIHHLIQTYPGVGPYCNDWFMVFSSSSIVVPSLKPKNIHVHYIIPDYSYLYNYVHLACVYVKGVNTLSHFISAIHACLQGFILLSPDYPVAGKKCGLNNSFKMI